MRNATVGALTYEFLFDVYRKMDDDRKRGSRPIRWEASYPDRSVAGARPVRAARRWPWDKASSAVRIRLLVC
jgi:hypothetical protein